MTWVDTRRNHHTQTLGKTCPDCGKVILDDSTYCRACSHNHRGAFKCGPSGLVSDTDFTRSRLYNGTLNKRLAWTLGLPSRMCVHFGTMACLSCTKAPPPWCPALDGHPDQQCENCETICPCNGTLKGEQ